MRKALSTSLLCAATALAADQVQIDMGILEGTRLASGLRIFKGIPYAAPPVGDLRWRAPQPVKPWRGVRPAGEFGSRCMQTRPWADMLWQSPGESEDCLNLTVWTPARTAKEKLPVFFWIHGGGFTAGAGDEKRHNGEAFAKHGVIVVNINYRLGVLGFLAHPELTKESGINASGNYGLMDQIAALQWVKRNIAAFGGDPAKVTIAGESAGSFAVSALMMAPQARGLFRGAIAESGAFLARQGPGMALGLGEAEKYGEKFAAGIGAAGLADLRAKPVAELMAIVTKDRNLRFWPIVDGSVIPEAPEKIFAAGKQAKVSLMAGWTRDEMSNGGNMDMSDTLIIYPTWKMTELHLETSGKPVYRFRFDQVIPAGPAVPAPKGAAHATEIEYVFGTLEHKDLPWREEDRKVSEIMNGWWANFVKRGDPNGKGLPKWPAYEAGSRQVMQIEATPRAVPEPLRERYVALDTATGTTAPTRPR